MRRPFDPHAVALAVIALAFAGVACRREDAAPAPGAAGAPVVERAPATAAAPAPAAAPAAAPADPVHPLPEDSIYELELALHDAHGATVGLDTWRGHPTIVTMFYASCPAACPRIVEDIRAIERALPAARRADLRVLMVSFDQARDTPAALTEMAASRGVPLDRWRLAAVSDDEARELAAVLGVKYRALDGGEFFHTSVLTLLDGEGHAIARIEGLGRDHTPILEKLK